MSKREELGRLLLKLQAHLDAAAEALENMESAAAGGQPEPAACCSEDIQEERGRKEEP